MALNAEPSSNGHSDPRQLAPTRVQVVNENKEFTYVFESLWHNFFFTILVLVTYRKDLNNYIDQWGLLGAGFGYDVVAVFGSQSTGKSMRNLPPHHRAFGKTCFRYPVEQTLRHHFRRYGRIEPTTNYQGYLLLPYHPIKNPQNLS